MRNKISLTQKEDSVFSEKEIKGIPNGIIDEKVNSKTLSEDSDWDPEKQKKLRKSGYSTKKHTKHDRKSGYSTKKHTKHKKHDRKSGY